MCCISTRYAVSDSCCKELSLADLLHKPIIPVMIEKTPWPPPGPVALLLSQLVYVDLAGTGGHGGVGKHGDWRKRVADLTVRLRSYITVLDPGVAASARRFHRPPPVIGKSDAKTSEDRPAEAAEVGGGAGGDEEGDDTSRSSGSTTPSSSSSGESVPASANPMAWIAAASGLATVSAEQQQQQWMLHNSRARSRCCGSSFSACQIM